MNFLKQSIMFLNFLWKFLKINKNIINLIFEFNLKIIYQTKKKIMSGIEAQPFIYIKLSSRKIKNPLNFSESNLLNYEILPKSNILLASSSNSFKVS